MRKINTNRARNIFHPTTSNVIIPKIVPKIVFQFIRNSSEKTQQREYFMQLKYKYFLYFVKFFSINFSHTETKIGIICKEVFQRSVIVYTTFGGIVLKSFLVTKPADCNSLSFSMSIFSVISGISFLSSPYLFGSSQRVWRIKSVHLPHKIFSALRTGQRELQRFFSIIKAIIIYLLNRRYLSKV